MKELKNETSNTFTKTNIIISFIFLLSVFILGFNGYKLKAENEQLKNDIIRKDSIINKCVELSTKVISNINDTNYVYTSSHGKMLMSSGAVIEDNNIICDEKAGYNLTAGHNNMIIGKGAGRLLTFESYCIIIGEDSIAQNWHGVDCIFYIDEDYIDKCPYLKNKCELKEYLRNLHVISAADVYFEIVNNRKEIQNEIKKYIVYDQ